MSVVLTAKEAVYASLQARFSGKETLVSWGDPGKLTRTQSVWFTDTTEPDITHRALSAGRRKPADVTAELTIRCVASIAGDAVRSERAVYAMRDVIEAAVLDGIEPSSVSADLVDIRPIRAVITSGETGDGRPGAMCDLTVRIRARTRS